MSSPSKISGLPLGTVTSDDYLVYVDRADGTTKKAEVSQVSGGNGKTSYIFSSVNSDIGGYESMPSLTSYTIGTLGTVSQTTNTTATLLASFVTPIGFPNVTVIPEGLFTSHFETQKSAGSNNYHTFFELYKRTVGGAETLLATSDNSTSSATNTVQSVSLTALLTSNVTLALTDRIVIKVYAQMTSGSATITLRYDDGTNARLEMVSSLVDASNFIPYTGATQNVNLGANSIIAVNLNGTLSGTSSGTNTGDQTTITGNAGSATVLQTARTINGVSFDGSANITVAQGGDTTNNLGYLNIPQDSVSANYTFVLADSGKHKYHHSADTTARTWTIPANASVAYPIGTALTFVNDTSAGVITIAITSDTLVLAGAGTTGSRTLAANGIATAIKVTSTRWMISGTNLT